jgi:GTP cyclohydrolase I
MVMQDERIHDRRSVDDAEAAVADLLTALGYDVGSERLRDTPRRVAASLRSLVTRAPLPESTFLAEEAYDGPVELRDIPFHSLCEHHLLPFRGMVHIAYLPGSRLVGISALPRIVEHFAHDLQIQERLTRDIADWLDRELQPRGLTVVIEAEHLCMSLRGIGGPNTTVTTRESRGGLRREEVPTWSVS